MNILFMWLCLTTNPNCPPPRLGEPHYEVDQMYIWELEDTRTCEALKRYKIETDQIPAGHVAHYECVARGHST
jgi:hypothetical protein